jgi:hypothetical protein
MVGSQGIVLERFFPKKNLVCVFSEEHGKVFATTRGKNLDFLWPGTIFSSVLVPPQGPTIFVLDQVKRQSQVFGVCIEKLFWLQSFLKLCCKVIPAEQECKETFSLLQKIFVFGWNQLSAEQLNFFQKVCMIKFLKASGFIFGKQADFLNAVFEDLTSFKVDLSRITALQSLADELHLNVGKEGFLQEQLETSLGRDLSHQVLRLLGNIPMQDSFENEPTENL